MARPSLAMALPTVLMAPALLLAGVGDVLVYGGPFLLIAGLLLSGRFVGEDRIIRRRSTRARPPARRVARPWPRLPATAAVRLLDRTPASRRGPPVLPARA